MTLMLALLFGFPAILLLATLAESLYNRYHTAKLAALQLERTLNSRLGG